jgi:hypothetical protein
MDQFVESGEQIGLGLGARLHSCTRIPYPIRRLDARLHFRHGLDDGVAAHAGSFGHQCLRVWTAHPNCRTDDNAALELVQVWKYHLEESSEYLRGDLHTARA